MRRHSSENANARASTSATPGHTRSSRSTVTSTAAAPATRRAPSRARRGREAPERGARPTATGQRRRPPPQRKEPRPSGIGHKDEIGTRPIGRGNSSLTSDVRGPGPVRMRPPRRNPDAVSISRTRPAVRGPYRRLARRLRARDRRRRRGRPRARGLFEVPGVDPSRPGAAGAGGSDQAGLDRGAGPAARDGAFFDRSGRRRKCLRKGRDPAAALPNVLGNERCRGRRRTVWSRASRSAIRCSRMSPRPTWCV